MLIRDQGSSIRVLAGFSPVITGAATINGAAIDRIGFGSAVLHGRSGAVAGAPSAQTYDLRLQESPDGATGWVDITGSAIPQIVAVNAESERDIDLSGAQRFIRAVGVIAFTGGTTPTLAVDATVVLGGSSVRPV